MFNFVLLLIFRAASGQCLFCHLAGLRLQAVVVAFCALCTQWALCFIQAACSSTVPPNMQLKADGFAAA
jgi:hypothetical protein